MARKIPIIEKRRWLEEYEAGKSEYAIALGNKRDTRTIKKALEDARRERDARLARSELMKDALRNHQDTLKEELNEVIKNLETPRGDFAPLSWHKGDTSVFLATAKGAGRPSEASTTVIDLLRQHLKNDKLWKFLKQWEKAHTSHIAARAALQRKVVSLLEQKTGYKLVEREIPSPFLYSYTAGPLVYEAALSSALDPQPTSYLEKGIVIDTKAGWVKYHNSILAEAPGDEENSRNNILAAYTELLTTTEFEQVKNSYKNLTESAPKVRQAADEIAFLGYIPGQCRVCRRLGM